MNETNQDVKPLTFGEKAVGITFNPSNDPNVQELKELYAKIIDVLVNRTTPDKFQEENQWIYEAIRQTQTAQMWAVKAVTYK